jgi:predicted GNAT superfamily acetyltransferase
MTHAGTRSISVAECVEVDDLDALAELFAAVWGGRRPPVTREMLRALSVGGSYVAGAHAGGDLIGGALAFLARDAVRGLHLHSHLLGVVPRAQGLGVGYALKQHQRSWALRHGIETVTWTFDPLVRRNAYFNLVRLGAAVDRYLVDHYGLMTDAINAGDQSDRLRAVWSLRSPAADRAARAQVRAPDSAELTREGAVLALRDEGGEPVDGNGEGRRLLCQVPADIVALRTERPDAARRWRAAVRRLLTSALERGSRVEGFTSDGCYLLG